MKIITFGLFSMYKLAFENLVFKDMNFFFGNYESTVEEFDSKIYDEIHFRSNFTSSLRTSGENVIKLFTAVSYKFM